MTRVEYTGAEGVTGRQTGVVVAAAGVIVLAFIICLDFVHFYVGLNDFWGNYLLAENLDFRVHASWFNGFFPIGYTLLIKASAGLNPAIFAHIINMGLLFGMLVAMGLFLLRVTNTGIALAAMVITALFPKLFGYFLTAGPDIGCMIWSVIAAMCLLTPFVGPGRDPGWGDWFWIIGGIAGGLSGLWRYHGLILSGFLLIAVVLVFRVPFRRWGKAAIALGVVYSLQFGANLASGHGLLETSQSFNVYKTVYGIDWYHVNAAVIPTTISGVIKLSPGRFFHAYFHGVEQIAPLILYLVLVPLAVIRTQRFRVTAGISLALIPYLLIVIMGGSERADIPCRALMILQGAIAVSVPVNILRDRMKGFRVWGPAALAAIVALFAVHVGQDHLSLLKWRRAEFEIIRSVQGVLVGESVRSARQVFCSNGDFYLPGIVPYLPQTIAGWGRFHFYGYNERYPILDTSSRDRFHQDCEQYHITHLVLDSTARFWSTALADLYDSEPASGFRLIRIVDSYRIYRVETR